MCYYFYIILCIHMALEEVSTTWLIHFMLLRLVASYLMNTWIQSSPCCNYITHGRHIPHSHKEGDTLEAYPALEKKSIGREQNSTYTIKSS